MESLTEVAFSVLFASMVNEKIQTHFDLIESKDNGSKRWACKTCKVTFTSSGDKKQIEHILGIRGQISSCSHPNPEMQAYYRIKLAEKVSQISLLLKIWNMARAV
jgi:hypothetical protein